MGEVAGLAHVGQRVEVVVAGVAAELVEQEVAVLGGDQDDGGLHPASIPRGEDWSRGWSGRLRIDLAYDGAAFHGWAAQPGLRTVQGDLEAALATVLRLPTVVVICAGRTDTGVHARGQVVHVDLPDGAGRGGRRTLGRGVRRLVRRLNGVLRPTCGCGGSRPAPEGFDARFSALWRRYAYRVVDDPALVDPLTRGHVLAWPRPLDLAR